MKKITIILVPVIILLLILAFIFTRNKKNTPNTPTETTKTSKEIELSADEKPLINLIPRADGHELKLKITNIPSQFSTAEYELIYTAEDENLEIEKGVSGTIKLTSSSFEKDLLLGTESCTNGCKYKYDEGITGGVLTLTLTTDDKEYFTFETPFVIRNSAQINKDKGFSLIQENFEVKATTTTKSDFFIAIKNTKAVYSVFSNGNGNGKITTISPDTITKENLNSLIGDYLIP